MTLFLSEWPVVAKGSVKFHACRSTTLKIENGNTESIVLRQAFFLSLRTDRETSWRGRVYGYGLDTGWFGTRSSMSRTLGAAEYLRAFT
jgi:hypothetical protein